MMTLATEGTFASLRDTWLYTQFGDHSHDSLRFFGKYQHIPISCLHLDSVMATAKLQIEAIIN